MITRQPRLRGDGRVGTGDGNRGSWEVSWLRMGRKSQPARPSKGIEDEGGFNGEREGRMAMSLHRYFLTILLLTFNTPNLVLFLFLFLEFKHFSFDNVI